MYDDEISFPTPQEIDAQIRAAEKARAQMIGNWLRAAAQWLAHPQFGVRTA